MRTTVVKFVAWCCGLSFAAILLAYPPNSAQAQTDDPAARAMERVRATVDERAVAAEAICRN
jgi:hypothetical protein